MNFVISALLAADTPKTIAQLLAEAVTARTYALPEHETNELNRIIGGAQKIFIVPLTEIYMMDAYKSGLVVGDFTAVPGGGVLLEAGISRYIGDGVQPGSRVLFSVGAPATIYFDIQGF